VRDGDDRGRAHLGDPAQRHAPGGTRRTARAVSSDAIVRRRGAVIGSLTEAQRDWHALRTGTCSATALPLPVIIVLETYERGDAMLTRYDVRGEFCGNTWHASEDAAEEQARIEFADARGEWMVIPAGDDPVEALLRERGA